jgi:hypothetical protein
VPERRASRFAVEVLILVVLAVAITIAELKTILIVGLMLLGWIVVAVLEWAAWRSEAHFESGLPPRYYVPELSLPARRPLEPPHADYPVPAPEGLAPTLDPPALGAWVDEPPAEEPPPPELEAEVAEAEPAVAEEPAPQPEDEPAPVDLEPAIEEEAAPVPEVEVVEEPPVEIEPELDEVWAVEPEPPPVAAEEQLVAEPVDDMSWFDAPLPAEEPGIIAEPEPELTDTAVENEVAAELPPPAELGEDDLAWLLAAAGDVVPEDLAPEDLDLSELESEDEVTAEPQAPRARRWARLFGLQRERASEPTAAAPPEVEARSEPVLLEELVDEQLVAPVAEAGVSAEGAEAGPEGELLQEWLFVEPEPEPAALQAEPAFAEDAFAEQLPGASRHGWLADRLPDEWPERGEQSAPELDPNLWPELGQEPLPDWAFGQPPLEDDLSWVDAPLPDARALDDPWLLTELEALEEMGEGAGPETEWPSRGAPQPPAEPEEPEAFDFGLGEPELASTEQEEAAGQADEIIGPPPEPEVVVEAAAEPASESGELAAPFPATRLPEEGEPVARAVSEVADSRAAVRTARHHLDPLRGSSAGRWPWRREGRSDEPVVEVPARPEGLRGLPGRPRRNN